MIAPCTRCVVTRPAASTRRRIATAIRSTAARVVGSRQTLSAAPAGSQLPPLDQQGDERDRRQDDPALEFVEPAATTGHQQEREHDVRVQTLVAAFETKRRENEDREAQEAQEQ